MKHNVSVPQQPKKTPRRIPNNYTNTENRKNGHKSAVVTVELTLQDLNKTITNKFEGLINKYKPQTKIPPSNRKAFFLAVLNKEPFQEFRRVECLIQEEKRRDIDCNIPN